jgi:hypothetical protein
MAIGDPYVTLAEIKDYLKIKDAEVRYDDLLTNAIYSASRQVELLCSRQFNKTTTATARTYIPTHPTWSDVDDFHTITGLVVKTDETGNGMFDTTWASSDYELYPFGGVIDGLPDWPFSEIRAVASRRFPCRRYVTYGRRARLEVTAQWGWSVVPDPVRMATFAIAAEQFQMKDAPLGVAGSDQFGNVIRVRDMKINRDRLGPYVKNRVEVG